MNQPHRQTDQPSMNLKRKLLFVLIFMAVLPITALATTLATGMYQLPAIAGAIACQVFGAAFGYHLFSGIVRQTATINQTLASINRGDFEARAEYLSRDELGLAASALNEMSDSTLNLIQSNEERDKIQNSIESLISEMKEIAAGDLTIETAVNQDMTGSIAESVNDMTTQLRSIVRRVQTAAQQVTTSANRISEASTSMSQDSDDQAIRISRASEELLQMTDSFQAVATMTKESVLVAVDARQTASDGLQAVSNTVDGMQRIRHQVQGTSKRIKALGESTQEIGEIVQVISDIADRTSILALNASIQAAMAGEAGQGFAVVAEEIECLAERSTGATKQISKLIRAIQNETNEVTSDMEEATREVVAGSELAAQAGVTLFEIDSVSNQLVELIQASSASALEQAQRAANIASSMSQISQCTRNSADQSRFATQSVGQLAGLVNQLRDSVSQFKVSSNDVREVESVIDQPEPGIIEPVFPLQPTAQATASVKSPVVIPPVTPVPVPVATPRSSVTKTMLASDGRQTEPSKKRSESQRRVPSATVAKQHNSDFSKSKLEQKPAVTETRVASATRLSVPKTLLNGGHQEERETLPENVDEQLLRQVRETTQLVKESNELSSPIANGRSETKVESIRQVERTIMLDNEK